MTDPADVQLTAEQRAMLLRFAAGPLKFRDKLPAPVLEQLLQLKLLDATIAGRASMQFWLNERGRARLAELRPATVYEVDEVRGELAAFLASWLPADRPQPFKANLAYLVELVAWWAGTLERARLRCAIGEVVGPAPAAEQPLRELLADPERPTHKGKSSAG